MGDTTAPTLSTRDAAPLEDFLLGFLFRLDVGDVVAGFFTEINGIGSENEVVESKVVDATGHEVVRKVPGRLKWTDISLKRGVTSSLQLWKWRQQIIDGKVKDARKPVTIHMLDREYKAVAKWNFFNAWPSKLTGPTFKSDSNDVGIEELTLVHEGMFREL
jgi:phage tail-like protein